MRQHGMRHGFKRVRRLLRAVARRWHTGDLDRAKQVEPRRDLGPRRRRDVEQRGERHHAVGGFAPHVELPDVLGARSELGLRLDVDPVQAAEPVEIVDVRAAHERREALEHLVDGHAELTRLLPIEGDGDLGRRRVERGEEVCQLGALSGLGQERLSLPAQVLDRQRAAAILQQEVEAARGAEAGDRGRHEGKRDSAGELRQGGPHRALNARDV